MAEDKRTAIVTGGNRGLGFETCRQLAQRDYRLILTSRDPALGQQAAGRLPGEVHFHALDVTDAGSVEALYDWATLRFGRVDVLVNNAGVFLDRNQSLLDLPFETFQTTLETNTLGALRLCRAFMPGMLQQNYGRIVNVSSGMGQMDSMVDSGASYRLSKLALNGLTQILADAARPKNVLVNAVCPGWVRTDMGGPNAGRSLEVGAAGIVWAAALPDGGPNGGLFRDGEKLDW